MSIQVYPPAAAGGDDVWVTIATASPTSGSTVSFTSISGYKKLWLVGKLLRASAQQYLDIIINNDTAGYNYHLVAGAFDYITSSGVVNTTSSGTYGATSILIENANKSDLPKPFYTPVYNSVNNGFYIGDAVSSINITLPSATFSSGTFTLYGVAA